MTANMRNSFWKIIYKLIEYVIPRERIKTVEVNYLTNSVVTKSITLTAPLYFKTKQFDDSYLPMIKTFEGKQLLVLNDAILDIQTGHVFIIDSTGKLTFLEASSEWPKERIKRELTLPNPLRIPTVSHGSIGHPNVNYFHLSTHWLANSIKLAKEFNPILVSPFSHPLSLEIADYYCLPTVAIEERWVRVRNLSMLSLSPIGYLNPQDLKLIRQERKVNKSRATLIYVSRRKSSRSVPGEILIEEELKKRGFTILLSENFGYADQNKIFSNAKMIVGPHGAGLVNAIYSNRGIPIIEIMPTWRFNRCIEWQSALCGQNYHRVFYSRNENELSIVQKTLAIVDAYA